RIKPGCKDFMLASHMGREKAMKLILEELGLEPVIQGDLALGEGTGAVMLFPLLDMAKAVYDGSTFSDIQVGQYRRFDHES
ncbi:MAG: nicotinate-nucleotide--dimethylbenzimidazole phosphoribosyltransferase, partial [Lachnospiraceae bacterium]|nr:nicotinate-nucleotide--dimethylbenzimidazole phosphoribosyltransferase [Lachnospiraceae bacterium]